MKPASIEKEKTLMKKIYFTITGTQFYHGSDFLKPGMKVRLEKEPDNRYDKKATGTVKVVLPTGVICRLDKK